MPSFFQKLFKSDDNISKENTLDESVKNICGLMIEAAMIDGKIDDSEIKKISKMLNKFFQIDEIEISNIIQKCIEESENQTSFYQFTKKINSEFSYEKKIELIEMLWEIVFSDGQLHDFESSFIRRLSGLLYLKSIDTGNAMKRAMQKNDEDKK